MLTAKMFYNEGKSILLKIENLMDILLPRGFYYSTEYVLKYLNVFFLNAFIFRYVFPKRKLYRNLN